MEAKYYDFYHTELLERERHLAQAEKDSLIDLAKTTLNSASSTSEEAAPPNLGAKLLEFGLLLIGQKRLPL